MNTSQQSNSIKNDELPAVVSMEPKQFFRQPTAEEVSRLSFGELPDPLVYAQEVRNHFAHLLNRGSSLE